MRTNEGNTLKMNKSAAIAAWKADLNGRLFSYGNNSDFNFSSSFGNKVESKYHLAFPDDEVKCLTTYKEAFRNEEPFSMEYRIKLDGSYRWVRETGVPNYDEQGNFIGFIGTIADIESKKEKELELLNQVNYYKDLVDNAAIAIHCIDEDGYIKWANQAELDLTGYSHHEYVGHHISEFYADKSVAEDMMKRLSNNKSLNNYEFRFRCKDGSVKYLSMCSNVMWKKGQFEHTRCFTTDISERKNLEDRLRERNKTLQILNSIGNTISSKLDLKTLVQSVTDASTGISGAEVGAFYYNFDDNKPGVLDIFTVSGSPNGGYKKDPMPEHIDRNVFNENSIIRIEDITKEKGFKKSSAFVGMPKGAAIKSYMAIPVTSRTGEVLGGIIFGHPQPGVFTETTEILVGGIASQAAIAIDNARLFEAKKEGEERFRILAESIPQMIWTATPEGEIDYCNQKWVEYTGLSSEESIGMGWVQCIHKSDLIKSLRIWKNTIETGGIYEVEYRLRRSKDSMFRWHLVRALPIKDKHGHIIKWFGTCTDIDDQKKQNERKDEFISIASHELKTPLTSIKAYVQLVERLLHQDKKDQVEVYLVKTNNYIDRLNNLIADLLDVSRIQAGRLQFNMGEFDFDEMVTEAIESIQNTSTTHKIIKIGEVDAIVTGDKQRLEQVINNFLTNAIKYSPGQSKVEVEVKKDGNTIQVAVRDFGIGIAEEKLNKVFDRFYRVESAANKFPGLGIGLYISLEIIKRHKGKIWVESEEGKGSIFYFSIEIDPELTKAEHL